MQGGCGVWVVGPDASVLQRYPCLHVLVSNSTAGRCGPSANSKTARCSRFLPVKVQILMAHPLHGATCLFPGLICPALLCSAPGLQVHTMAVNEIAMRFYDTHGFVVEKEESSNQAHYRGRCLDGIEGRGRTVLLRDTRLHQG